MAPVASRVVAYAILLVAVPSCGESGKADPAAGVDSGVDAGPEAELAERYVACANDAGLEIVHVSAHDLPGVGIMVKAEIDVPASIHGPCLALIGGTSSGLSSWGNER